MLNALITLPNKLSAIFISSFLLVSFSSQTTFANSAKDIISYMPTKEAYMFSRTTASPRIAIIIDDIGYNIPLGQRTVNLEGKITLAVLPKTPGAQLLAKAGFASGKEIMLHAPMSNFNEFDLGPGALTEDLSKSDFIRTLNEDINNIPHVVGVNNHMGSRLTTLKEQMSWVMEVLKERDLYFVDSLTNGSSVAYRTAKRLGLTSTQRDIFLDHNIDEAYISRQFQKLIKRAHNQGYAIGIGHPYPETLSVLERLLPTLKKHGVELMYVSSLINPKKNKSLALSK